MLTWSVGEALLFVFVLPIALNLANTIGAFLDDKMQTIYRNRFKK